MSTHCFSPARARRLAMLTATIAALAACGGGSDAPALEDAAAPAPVAAPAPAPTPYAFTRTTDRAGVRTFAFLNPALAAPLVATLPDVTGSVFTGLSFTVDSAGDPVYLGAPQLIYQRQGSIFMIDMRKGKVPTEVQLSSLTTACAINDQFEVTADGSDTWSSVEEAGPDGNCATPSDNRIAMVRTTAAPTTAPVLLPVGVQPNVRLPQADMSLRWILAKDTTAVPPKLVLLTPELAPAGDVVGGNLGAAGDFILSIGWNNPRGTGHAFIDGMLKPIQWSSAGASVGASVYTFALRTQPNAGGLADGADAFFTAGASVLVQRGSAPATVLGTSTLAGASVIRFWLTPTQVVFQSSGTGGELILESIPRAGGAARVLIPSATVQQKVVVSVAGEYVAYRQVPASGLLADLHVIGANTGVDTTIATRAGTAGLINATSLINGRGTGASLLFCEPAVTAPDCAGAPLIQYDVATGQRTTIGTAPVVAGVTDLRVGSSSANGRDGQATVSALLGGVRVSDAYTFRVGEAGSLVRATTNLP